MITVLPSRYRTAEMGDRTNGTITTSHPANSTTQQRNGYAKGEPLQTWAYQSVMHSHHASVCPVRCWACQELGCRRLILCAATCFACLMNVCRLMTYAQPNRQDSTARAGVPCSAYPRSHLYIQFVCADRKRSLEHGRLVSHARAARRLAE